MPWVKTGALPLEEEGDEAAPVMDTGLDRRSIIPGMFYGIQGMRLGGTRTLRLAPHLAYGERGIPGRIPANAELIIEVVVLSAGQS